MGEADARRRGPQGHQPPQVLPRRSAELARTGLETLLNESGRSVRGSRNTHRTLRVLIVGEIAVAITLVAGAGWVVKSFAKSLTRACGSFGRSCFQVGSLSSVLMATECRRDPLDPIASAATAVVGAEVRAGWGGRRG